MCDENEFYKVFLPIIVVIVVIIISCNGCTVRNYQRRISRTYDASGTLISTTITDGIEQRDPNQHPVHTVFRDVNYKKPDFFQK